MFRKRGLHFIHLNINSLLLKIDELRSIAKTTRAAIIGISESKLDKTVFNSEVAIEGYDLIRKDRNRHGGVLHVILETIFGITLNRLYKTILRFFFDLLLPKPKAITVGIIYKPPNQTDFLDKLSTSFSNYHLIDKDSLSIK